MIAPVTGTVSALRQARTFHPDGTVFRAVVESAAPAGQWTAVAARLEGAALVRMSTALWRGEREWIDALGCAVRFRRSDVVTPVPAEGDQDLLFATIRSPWTTLVAPLRTHVHDYLANDYYAVSPFRLEGIGKVKWRLVTPHIKRTGHSRLERLHRAVSRGEANLLLQARPTAWRAPWVPVALIRLEEPVEIEQAALRFSPFRAGRGIEPTGFVHALRRGTYWASQKLRPSGPRLPHPSSELPA
jgi:hypothetical protein